MQPIRQAVRVDFQYPVHFVSDLFAPANPLLRDLLAQDAPPNRAPKILCVLDAGLVDHHPALPAAIAAYFLASAHASLVTPPLVFPGGETVKNDPAHVTAVHRAIHEFGIDRHSYVIAIGGGAMLDAVGLVAATTHRGVRLIRVPTTVLAQAEARLA